MAIGGDFVEITFNHPDHGSGVLLPKAGEEGTLELGGYRSDDDDNGIDGGGNMIDIMKRVRPSFSCPIAWDMVSEETLEKLDKLAGSTKPANWTFTHISGVIYGGKGKPVGSISGNGGAATTALKVAGSNKFKKQ